jgi:threonine dehydratase
MNQTASKNRGIQLEDILIAYRELKEIVLHTP